MNVNLYIQTNLNRPVRATEGRYLWILECAGATLTSGNVMEDVTQYALFLSGLLDALKHMKKKSTICIYQDCSYFYNSYTNGHVRRWAENGWKKSPAKDVANKELWEEVYKILNDHYVTVMPERTRHEFSNWMDNELKNDFTKYLDRRK